MLTTADSKRKLNEEPAVGSMEEALASFMPTVREADGTPKWGDEPDLKDQHKKPGLFDMGPAEVAVLDMSNEKDQTRYGELLTGSYPEANGGIINFILHDHDRRFCEKISNWKIFITYSKVKYKKIIKKGQPNESEPTTTK